MKKRKNIACFVLIAALFSITCTVNQDGNLQAGETRKACPAEPVFQLNWTNDPTFTGEYVAYEKTWVTTQMKVTVREGGIAVDPISTIESGTADYAVVGADKALIAIAGGAAIRIVAVDFQRNPVGWIVRNRLNINSFNDIDGKDVILGDKTGTEVTAILKLVLQRKGIKTEPRGVGFDFAYFLTNENVVFPVYLNEEPVRARLLHQLDVVELDPAAEENGAVRLYGNVIITRAEMLERCGAQVDAIVDGLRRGWNFAADPKNRDETVKIVNRYVQEDEEYVREVVKRTVKFATEFYGTPVQPGHMEISEWKSTLATLKEGGLITGEVDLNRAVRMK